MPGGNWPAAFEHDLLAALQHATQIARVQDISLTQPVVVLGINEHQRQHPIIDEVLPVNTGKPFCQHDS